MTEHQGSVSPGCESLTHGRGKEKGPGCGRERQVPEGGMAGSGDSGDGDQDGTTSTRLLLALLCLSTCLLGCFWGGGILYQTPSSHHLVSPRFFSKLQELYEKLTDRENSSNKGLFKKIPFLATGFGIMSKACVLQ